MDNSVHAILIHMATNELIKQVWRELQQMRTEMALIKNKPYLTDKDITYAHNSGMHKVLKWGTRGLIKIVFDMLDNGTYNENSVIALYGKKPNQKTIEVYKYQWKKARMI